MGAHGTRRSFCQGAVLEGHRPVRLVFDAAAALFLVLSVDSDADASGDVSTIYDSLNDRQKKAYDGLDRAVKNRTTLSGLDYLSVKEGEEVRNAYKYDHPEVWYFTGSWTLYVYTESDRCFEFRYEPLFSEYEIRLMDVVLMASLPSIDMSFANSDHKKVMMIHDWLCRNVVYTDRLPGDDKDHKGDIYGVFVEKKAVCEGYTKAFTYLCHQYGLDCVGVTGSTYKSGGASDHAWNLVKVDGSWYYVDVTWDDPAWTSNGVRIDTGEWKVDREYMLIGSLTKTSHGTFAYDDHMADSLYGISPSDEAHVLMEAASPMTGFAFYDGGEKTGIGPSDGYTVEGGSGVEKGRHTAVLSLKPGYIWSDGMIEDNSVDWYVLDPVLIASMAATLAALLALAAVFRFRRRKSGAICPSCGGKLGKNDDFCPACGQYREWRRRQPS